MGDIIILKNDGRFTYSDYGSKTAYRLVELASDGAQVICRTYEGATQAVLMSKSLYDSTMASATPNSLLTQSISTVADDYMASNLAEMVDLLQSRVQAPGQESKVASQGTTASAQKTFAIVNSSAFQESGQADRKGTVLGYLVTPRLYSYLVEVPGAPTGVVGTSGNTQVVLTWVAPVSSGGSAISTYVVEYSSNGGTSWTVHGGMSPGGAVTGLTNGTAYVFRVQAINSAGAGPYSSVSAPVTPA